MLELFGLRPQSKCRGDEGETPQQGMHDGWILINMSAIRNRLFTLIP